MRARSAFLVGVGAAYLFDPRQGKRRRTVLVGRSLGVGRRLRRVGIGKLKFVGGHVRGLFALVRGRVLRPRVATDDQTVAQRIKSDAFRDIGVSTREVAVEVDEGLVTLRGSIVSPTLSDQLVERVRKVPGVQKVSTELRIGGGVR